MQSRLIRLVAALLALALLAGACGDDTAVAEGDDTSSDDTAADDTAEADDTATEPGTIVDVAAGAGSFTTLVAAVEAAGLVDTLSGEGPFTVFAPTDDAFAAALDSLGLTAEELLASDDLASILTYHVVAGNVPSSDVVTLNGQSVATVNGAEVDITVDGSTVMVNDATVVTVDIAASNGVIHVIDTVLLPPTEDMEEPAEDEAMEEPGTIVDVAVAAGSFPTLIAAVEAAGLVDTLNGEGPYTVFAPTEEAFAAALDALGMTAEELLADTELLTSVLTYHVLPLEALAATVLTLDGQSVATVNGAEVMVTIDGDTVMVNDATVVTVDIAASNGVIHVIDTVLLPPA